MKNITYDFSDMITAIESGKAWRKRESWESDPLDPIYEYMEKIASSIIYNSEESYDDTHTRAKQACDKLLDEWRVDSYEDYALAIDKLSSQGNASVSICCAYRNDDDDDEDIDINRDTKRQLDRFMREFAQVVSEKKSAKVVIVDAYDSDMLEAVARYQDEGEHKDKYEILWDESGTLDSVALFASGDIAFKENYIAENPHYLFYMGEKPLGTYYREGAELTLEQYSNKTVLGGMEQAVAHALTWFGMERDEGNGDSCDVMVIPELIRAFTAGHYCAIGGEYENYIGQLHDIDTMHALFSCAKGRDFMFVYEDEFLGAEFDRCCKFLKDMRAASSIWQRVMEESNVVFVIKNEKFQDIHWALEDEGEEAARKLCATSFNDVQLFADMSGITSMVGALFDGVPMEDVLA